jgi:hypothetical protein
MAARTKAKATNHEWQTDALADPAANAHIEGDDSTATTAIPTVRLNNRLQIFKKIFAVSGTQEVVDKAGRESEIAYRSMKEGKVLKLDIEYALVRNQASSAGGAGTARTLASVESWIATNKTSVGTGTAQTTPGFSSGNVAAPTDSTVTGSVSETIFKAMVKAAWTAGGNPAVIMVGPGTKQKFSSFAGIATLYREAGTTGKGTRIVGAADLYVSDFGEHKIVPSRVSRDVTALGLDMDYWAVATLRGITREKLAKTGDSDKFHILTELTLESRNEKASFKIADINSAL